MTAIEDKRKELEQESEYATDTENQRTEWELCKARETFFNLGVKMGKEEAQKEIFDKLEMFEVNIRTRAGHDCLVDLAFIENSLEELNQSLNSPQANDSSLKLIGDSLNSQDDSNRKTEYIPSTKMDNRRDKDCSPQSYPRSNTTPDSRKGKGEKQ